MLATGHLLLPAPDTLKLQWSYSWEAGWSELFGEKGERTETNKQAIFPFYPLGPFGERDDQQVFIQKVVPITNKLFVRLSSTGKRYIHVLSRKEAGLGLFRW